MAYSCNVKENEIVNTSFIDGDGRSECAVLIKQVCSAPQTTSWRKGANVMEAQPGTIKRFVAIATFDSQGVYKGHAAIYISHSDRGIEVYDQWVERTTGNNRKPQKRPIRSRKYASPTALQQNIAENYYVVEQAK